MWRLWFEPVTSQKPAQWRLLFCCLVCYCNRFEAVTRGHHLVASIMTKIISIHVRHLKRQTCQPLYTKSSALKATKVASAWSVHMNPMFVWNRCTSNFKNYTYASKNQFRNLEWSSARKIGSQIMRQSPLYLSACLCTWDTVTRMNAVSCN